ncbi:acetolactate synthase [Salipiger aestuarii]|uniref:Acetolactate synthase-1/2/3 large subunit n=1 Tax=Salipiger aestuarii TaxID=568098 RepID=A0A327YSX1_9RHOB|nr:thiamine pyrophosphate-binding protein [Salipiger aestuarii]KAB2543313.1 acetolactate synthase [Salipiger aestuarii]RAK24023.1 acetolactate synthase-1/2/3 large subunit [Salipiger aestuarii]
MAGHRNRMNGAEAMVRALEAHGVTHIFGLCGDTTLPFYDAMLQLDHGITHVLTRDERSACYMADGYSRVTGRVGVCEGPSGGGATYILPGLIEANESSYAVLSITTDISVASYGKYPLTQVDQESLMRPLTKWNTVISRADHIPRMVRAAFRAMTTGRPGSAHLGLPYDIQYDAVLTEDIWADPALASYPAHRAAPAPGMAEAAADAILSAKRPLVVCGGGVVISGAMDALAQFSEALDLAVATSISGQGALADTHPLCLGVVGSNGGTDETWEMMQAADLVVFMGCRAGSTTTARWEQPRRGQRIVHIDSDPMVIGANYPTEVGVCADLKLTLNAMNDALQGREVPQFGGAAAIADIKARKFARFAALARRTGDQIRPEMIIGALNRLLPETATVVSDPGTSCPYWSAYGQLPLPGRRFITNRAHGALGYCLGAALGVWFGRPHSKVVGLMGDGSFAFACGELETVARIGAPVTYIVLSNAAFGWIKASQRDDCDKRYYNVDFNRSDQAMVAAGFGIKSYSVSDPAALDGVLAEALDFDGPTLVDVRCQPLEEAAAPVRRWMG